MAAKTRTAPRKTALQARSLATVDALLRATARILVREGYDRASTNKIAVLAGVSVGSLYQYFPSKEALVAALALRHMDEMAVLLRAAFPGLLAMSLDEAIREAVRLMVTAHALDPKLHRVLVEQLPRLAGREHLAAIESDMLRLTRGLLESKRAEVVVQDLDLAAFIVVTIVESLTHAAVISRPELLTPAFQEEVALAVIRYLRGATSPARGASATRVPTRARRPS